MKENIDPRTKIIIVLCLTSLAIIVNDIFVLLCIGLTSILVALLFGVKIFSLINRYKRLVILLLVISLVQSIFIRDDNVILSIFSIDLITEKGLEMGLRAFVRMVVILTCSSVMTTSNYRNTIQGLVQWKMPYKLAFMSSISLRFIPIFMEEFSDSINALMLRGVDIKNIKFKDKSRIYMYLLSPIVLSVMKRARELSVAMEKRGFGAYNKRSSYLILTLSFKDYLIMGLFITTSVLIILINFNII